MRSKYARPTCAACMLVPMPTSTTRSTARSAASSRPSDSSSTAGGSKMARPRNVSMTHSGCSMISLSMKCLYAPFAAETGSKGTV